MSELQRLQRILASRGVASRRGAEQLIIDGRVSVNGRVVTELGTKADPESDVIALDGFELPTQRHRFVVLHKPVGYITAVKDDRDRQTVMELIQIPERVYPIGRLDRNTEGLLLMTNHGELANRIMHPRYAIDKEYEVLSPVRPSASQLRRLSDGVTIDGVTIIPTESRILRETPSGVVIRLTIHEGLNRIVRRMMEEVQIPIDLLRRTRVGPISLAGIPRATWRDLTPGEVVSLGEAVHLDLATPTESRPRQRK